VGGLNRGRPHHLFRDPLIIGVPGERTAISRSVDRKVGREEGARRKYFGEKLYLPNHYFYKHSDTIQLVKQLFLFSYWK